MGLQGQKASPIRQEIHYPDSDGKPMADNTLQALWIIMLYDNLRGLFADQEVFIAADLFWYPIEGDPYTKVAPDVMVVFGRPDGHRGSYKQWLEENIAPQVVFEVLSPSNTGLEMLNKLDFYERHGVSEFIILDPEKNAFMAYVSVKGKLIRDDRPDQAWKSPKLGISFKVEADELRARLHDGTPFKTFAELIKSFEEVRAEKEALKAEKEMLKAEKDTLKAEKDSLKAEKDSALEEVERLRARLNELGQDPDE